VSPTAGLSVATIFEDAYVRFGGRRALLGDGAERSYAELGERAHRFASALRARGVEPGDRVALVAPNSLPYIEASHGIFTGGFVRVALSSKLHPEEIGGILADCGARAVVVSPEWAERLDRVPAAAEALAIVLGEDGTGRAVGFEQLLAEGAPERPARTPGPEDLCALLYTSGTTGKPKGATLTHANWVAMIRNSMVEMPTLGSADVVLHVAPLSHLSGYFEPTLSARGATHVVHEAFDPAAVLDAIERERITVIPLVPTMLNLMLPEADARERDLSSLRAVMYGGSGIAPDRLAWALRAFGDVFCQFFGLSETPMPLTALSQADHVYDPSGPPPARLASAGRPNPFVELRLRDDDDATGVPATGEVGEILVRGDNVMVGYWGQPELTAETIDSEGWAATGDLGRFDEDGYLYIVDRKRDMIVSGGYNVYPAEVENAISVLTAVQEVAVVGVPDEQWGEAVRAVVVVRPGEELSEDEVVAACAERLAGYKKPRAVEFVAELPKTGSGKIMRRRVRDRFWDGRERSVGG
jgi:long-chain acyl-CoA synthetase